MGRTIPHRAPRAAKAVAVAIALSGAYGLVDALWRKAFAGESIADTWLGLLAWVIFSLNFINQFAEFLDWVWPAPVNAPKPPTDREIGIARPGDVVIFTPGRFDSKASREACRTAWEQFQERYPQVNFVFAEGHVAISRRDPE